MTAQNGIGAATGAPAPIIVLTAARSGSTLLRYILDTHPDLACPPETGMGGVCTHLTRFLGILDGTGMDGPPGRGAISADTEAVIVQLVNSAYGQYLKRQGKRRWCDKSLDNILHAHLLATIFPDAQFLCLARHCMDVVASGVEVCSWGLHGFGFDSFSAQFPGNSVAAIAAYWADNIQGILEFEKAYPDRCHRIRYEDLVGEAEATASGIFHFLGAQQVPGITETCFRTDHETIGPGDEKILFTSKIEDQSVGRGVRVPAEMIPAPLLDHINGLLIELGYRQVTQEWNRGTAAKDPRADPQSLPPDAGGVSVPSASSSSASSPSPGSSPILSKIASLIVEQSEPFALDRQAEVRRRWPLLAGRTLRVLITEAGEQQEVRWTIPTGSLAVDGDSSVSSQADAVVSLAGDAITWNAILTGNLNMVIALRVGHLRWSGSLGSTRLSSDEALAIGVLLGLSDVRPAIAGKIPSNDHELMSSTARKPLFRVRRNSDR